MREHQGSPFGDERDWMHAESACAQFSEKSCITTVACATLEASYSGEAALPVGIGHYPSFCARMTTDAFRGIDPVGAFVSLPRLERPALAGLTGIVESIRVIGDFFRMK